MDPTTTIQAVNLLQTILKPDSVRKIFKLIVSKRIANKAGLEATSVDGEGIRVDSILQTLTEADLISPNKSGSKIVPSAKGLLVAEDLEQIRGSGY